MEGLENVLEGLATSKSSRKALTAMEGSVEALRERMAPSAKTIRNIVDSTTARLGPLLDKAVAILGRVASLNPASLVLAKLDLIGDIAKKKLDEVLTIDEIDLTTIAKPTPERVGTALDLVALAARNIEGGVKQLERSLLTMSGGVAVASDLGLSSKVTEVIDTIKGYLSKHEVCDVVAKHAKSVEDKVRQLKSDLTISDGTVQDVASVQEQISDILLNGKIELNDEITISFGELKDHIKGVVSAEIDNAKESANPEVRVGWC